MTSRPVLRKSQSGIVLVVSLIMLLLLTLIAVTGMQTTGLEEQMAGNMRDSNLAFQAAEAALVEGEKQVKAFSYNCINGRFRRNDINCDDALETYEIWENPAFNWSAKSIEYPGNAHVLGPGLADKPRYIIEDLGAAAGGSGSGSLEAGTGAEENSTRTYRITARGTGGTANAVARVQSVFRK